MDLSERRQFWVATLANHRGRDQLAKDLGYQDTNYLNQIVSGHTKLGNNNAKRWAEKLKLSPGWFDRPPEKESPPNPLVESDEGPVGKREQDFVDMYLMLGPTGFAEELANMAGDNITRDDAVKIAQYFLKIALERNES